MKELIELVKIQYTLINQLEETEELIVEKQKLIRFISKLLMKIQEEKNII